MLDFMLDFDEFKRAALVVVKLDRTDRFLPMIWGVKGSQMNERMLLTEQRFINFLL